MPHVIIRNAINNNYVRTPIQGKDRAYAYKGGGGGGGGGLCRKVVGPWVASRLLEHVHSSKPPPPPPPPRLAERGALVALGRVSSDNATKRHNRGGGGGAFPECTRSFYSYGNQRNDCIRYRTKYR